MTAPVPPETPPPAPPGAERDPRDGPIVLYDGGCGLCHRSVRAVLARERGVRFRFASLRSDAARRLLEGRGAPEPLPDSVVLIDAEGVHTGSTAALRIARNLRPPASLAAAFLALPKALRDPVYAFVARRRYRWFGRRDGCALPAPDERDRFLDAGEAGAPPGGAPGDSG